MSIAGASIEHRLALAAFVRLSRRAGRVYPIDTSSMRSCRIFIWPSHTTGAPRSTAYPPPPACRWLLSASVNELVSAIVLPSPQGARCVRLSASK
jgi:hypothetical protein